MPTLPVFDPAQLPPYPEKPHKTGQARVNVDGRSQYLGKYGTVESHALYHLACARKLITGVVPTTRDLRNEISHVAGDTEKRASNRSPRMVVGLLVFVAVLSGILSHVVTKASVRIMPSQEVVARKVIVPELPNTDVGEKTTDGDNRRPALNDATSQIVKETIAAYPNASIEDALGFAAEWVKTVPERSRRDGKQLDANDQSH